MQQNYIDVVRPALVDTLVLSRVDHGQYSVQDLARELQGAGIDLGDVDVEERVHQLEQTRHLRREGNLLRLTDDGREDVRKALGWFRKVVQQVETRTGMTR